MTVTRTPVIVADGEHLYNLPSRQVADLGRLSAVPATRVAARRSVRLGVVGLASPSAAQLTIADIPPGWHAGPAAGGVTGVGW
jgi:hypothetical protein